jgi:hypothetical protein
MMKPICSFRAQLLLWLGGSIDLHNCHSLLVATGGAILAHTFPEDCGNSHGEVNDIKTHSKLAE